MNTKTLPPQDYLHKLFKYDADTGIVTRRLSMGNRKKGSIVGYKRKDGYLSVVVLKHRFLLHRIILEMNGGLPTDKQADHINGVRDDNRLSNLRKVSASENSQNLKLKSNNTSGRVGVHYIKSNNKWMASITANNSTYYLGKYDKFEDAAIARENAEIKYGFHVNHGRK